MGNMPPAEAIDRLGRFREGFNIRQRKQELYSSGEMLFKLPVTEYPEIGVTGKELSLTENVRFFFFILIFCPLHPPPISFVLC